MLDNNLLKCPINLKFDYDWNRVRRVYTRILEKKAQGNYQSNFQESYQSTVYSLGSHGAIISNTVLTNHEWNTWAGPLLEFILPGEIHDLSNKLLKENLNFINFGYFIHYGEIKKHSDGMSDPRAKDGHCNINYIISSSDSNAKTVLYNPELNIKEEYPSVVGTTWILDSSSLHWVENTGTREIFQIKIFSPFSQVKQFFADQNLI